jgi:preprotein translocase subunit SecB
MKKSPLQLKGLFFVKVAVEAGPELDAAAECDIETKHFVDRLEKADRTWNILLSVTTKPPKEKKAPYTIDVEVYGRFQVSDDWPKEKTVALVYANGTSLLYGAVREMVANLTARGPHGMVVLPTLSFVNTIPKAETKKD